MNAPTKARRRILTADPARGRRTRTPDGPFRRPPISIHMTQAEFDAEAARLFRLRARHPGRASRITAQIGDLFARVGVYASAAQRERGPVVEAARREKERAAREKERERRREQLERIQQRKRGAAK